MGVVLEIVAMIAFSPQLVNRREGSLPLALCLEVWPVSMGETGISKISDPYWRALFSEPTQRMHNEWYS